MKIETSNWSGPRSKRFRMGHLWMGYNLRKGCRALFMIYNGKHISWQVQTWRPRLAFWRQRKAEYHCGTPFKGKYKVKVKHYRPL